MVCSFDEIQVDDDGGEVLGFALELFLIALVPGYDQDAVRAVCEQVDRSNGVPGALLDPTDDRC